VIRCGVVGNITACHAVAPGSIPGTGVHLLSNYFNLCYLLLSLSLHAEMVVFLCFFVFFLLPSEFLLFVRPQRSVVVQDRGHVWRGESKLPLSPPGFKNQSNLLVSQIGTRIRD
jgi:hypothetical protein